MDRIPLWLGNLVRSEGWIDLSNRPYSKKNKHGGKLGGISIYTVPRSVLHDVIQQQIKQYPVKYALF